MADTLTAEQRAVLAELRRVQRRLDLATIAQTDTLERRLELVEVALSLGLRLRWVAEHIGVREGALGQARYKARNGNRVVS